METGESFRKVLSKCEYPFNWGIEALPMVAGKPRSEVFKGSLSEYSEEYLRHQDQRPSFTFKRFILHFALAFELGQSQDWSGCLNEMANCLNWCKSEDYMNKKYNKGFMTVVNAFMAHVHLEMENVEEAREFIDALEEMGNLSKENQSAVWALKSRFFRAYGEGGSALALEFAEKALALHPGEAWWHFQVGNVMFRQRHIQGFQGYQQLQAPSARELEAFRTANSLDPCPVKSLFLGLSTLEQARSTGKYNSQAYNEAFKVFKDILGNEEEAGEVCSVKMLIRVGGSLRKLSDQAEARDLALKTLLKGFAIAPRDIMVNHQLGLLYRSQRQLDEALTHLKIASEGYCFPATLAYFELASEVDPEGQGSPKALTEGYARAEAAYLEPSQPAYLHAHAASYHLSVTRDLSQVVRHMSKAIRLSKDKTMLKNFRNNYLKGRRMDLINESYALLRGERREWAGREREDVEMILAEGSGQSVESWRAATPAPACTNWRLRDDTRRNTQEQISEASQTLGQKSSLGK